MMRPLPHPHRVSAAWLLANLFLAAASCTGAGAERHSFLVGADISWVPQQESEGRRFSVHGVEKDVLLILREHGFNAIRLRLFCDPTAPGGYSDKGYCGLDSTLAMAARARDAGLQFLLDLHYSDTWADPAHQTKPAAWRDLDFPALTNTVYRYTRDTLAAFVRKDLTPHIVQVGNEISAGMLWPDGKWDRWDQLAGLLAAGIRGVRESAPAAQVMLHLALGGQNEKSRWFLDQAARHSLDFDLIGQSYYPRWHGSLDALKANLTDLARKYRQNIMVVEYSTPHVREVNDIVRALPNGKGRGTFIWEPTHPRHGNLFDREGRALPALEEYPRLAADWADAPDAPRPPASALAGVPFDLQGFLDQQLTAGAQRIVVPPGRYRVTPKNQQHLVLRGLKDVQILADGVEMICTETTRALTISRCTNLTVRGLAIDYDPLPFTQGRITAISADRQVYDIELFDGYPAAETARNFKYEVFRPDTRTLRCEDRGLSRIEVVDSRHLRLTSPGRHDRNPEQVDDLIVIGSEYAPHGGAAHAVECSHNVNVRLENIDLFASNCFGFLEYDCDGTTYFRCRIDRRSPADDFVRRADPRLRSLDADAFHSKHAIQGPAYLECTARFMGDDCVNICGDYHLIMASQGKELRVLAKGKMNIQPGDPVELVSYAGERQPDAKALSVESAGSIREDERAFLARQNMDARLKSGRGLGQAFTVTLDREEDIPRGGLICAANRIGNGFAVKGCDFGFNRSRGILIKASHGEVSGNRLEGCEMSAILVAPEYWWLEAGSSSDLNITGNTITACRGIPICVEATAGNGDIAPAGAHRNITITDNIVQDCPAPGIVVCSTAGLQLENNALQLNDTRTTVPGLMRKAGIKELQPVVTIHCRPGAGP